MAFTAGVVGGHLRKGFGTFTWRFLVPLLNFQGSKFQDPRLLCQKGSLALPTGKDWLMVEWKTELSWATVQHFLQCDFSSMNMIPCFTSAMRRNVKYDRKILFDVLDNQK